MCVEINKCMFDAKKYAFLEFIISRSRLRMDPDIVKANVNRRRPTDTKVVQELLGLWNC